MFLWLAIATMLFVSTTTAVSTAADPSIPILSSSSLLEPVVPITTKTTTTSASTTTSKSSTQTSASASSSTPPIKKPTNHDGGLTKPPAQPQCWVEALKIFHQPQNVEEMEITEKICQSMTVHQQKALAFELARCQLQDMGRSILQPNNNDFVHDAQDCTKAAASTSNYDDTINNNEDDHNNNNDYGLYFPNLQQCLSIMTDQAVNVYTQYKLRVVDLCNRLTQHLIIYYQQYAAQNLAKISQEATIQITNLLQYQQEIFHQQEQSMRDEHKEITALLKKQQEELVQDQTQHWENVQSWTDSIVEQWNERDQVQQAQHEAWVFNQSSIMEQRANELERQHQEIQDLAQTFASTTQLTLDTVLSRITSGFTLLTFMIHFLVISYVMWLLTRPRCCSRVRRVLFTIIILESLCEVAIHLGLEGGSSTMSTSEQKAIIQSFRQASYFLEGLVYILGFMLSCCCCCWSSGIDDDEDDDYEDDDNKQQHQQAGMSQAQFQKMLDETLAQQRNAQQLQQQQAMASGHLQHSFGSPFITTNNFPQGFAPAPNPTSMVTVERGGISGQGRNVVTCDGKNGHIQALKAQQMAGAPTTQGSFNNHLGIPPTSYHFTPVREPREREQNSVDNDARLLQNMKISNVETATKSSNAAAAAAAAAAEKSNTVANIMTTATHASSVALANKKRSREEDSAGKEDEDTKESPAKRIRNCDDNSKSETSNAQKKGQEEPDTTMAIETNHKTTEN